MTRDERLKVAQANTHRKLHDLQGETIQGLRRSVAGMQVGANATTETIRANRDILEAATRALQAAERAADRADHTLKETIKILALVKSAGNRAGNSRSAVALRPARVLDSNF